MGHSVVTTAPRKIGRSGAPAAPRHYAPAVANRAVPGMIWPALPTADAAEILALLYQLEHTQWWPESRLRDAQFAQLQALLDHAVTTVPYYRETLSRVGYAPGRPL